MPETRIERIVAVAALAAAGVLAFFTVLAWRDYRDSASDSSPAVAAVTSGTTGAVAATTATEHNRPAETGGSGAGSAVASRVNELVIRATRGPSWLSVHENSETGKRLYEGILARGDSERFVSKRLWVRFGFPANLTARLNGKPATLPSGTATVMVQGRRLRTVSLG